MIKKIKHWLDTHKKLITRIGQIITLVNLVRLFVPIIFWLLDRIREFILWCLVVYTVATMSAINQKPNENHYEQTDSRNAISN
jgi:hypothetical protein